MLGISPDELGGWLAVSIDTASYGAGLARLMEIKANLRQSKGMVFPTFSISDL